MRWWQQHYSESLVFGEQAASGMAELHVGCAGFAPLPEPWRAQFAGREQQSLSVPPPLCCPIPPRRRRRHSGARQGLRNRWFSTGLLSHFAHRMDSFLGKDPSFCTEGGYCIVWGLRLRLLQELEGVRLERARRGFDWGIWQKLWRFCE